MPEFRVLPDGDTTLVVESGDQIDRRLSTRVLPLAQRLGEARLNVVVETVPTYPSLIVHHDPFALAADAIEAHSCWVSLIGKATGCSGELKGSNPFTQLQSLSPLVTQRKSGRSFGGDQAVCAW